METNVNENDKADYLPTKDGKSSYRGIKLADKRADVRGGNEVHFRLGKKDVRRMLERC